MSDFGAISIAYSGLNAHRKRIDVIGENIANVDTPGYHRQRVHLTAIDNLSHGMFSGRSGRGGGVNATEVVRMRDRILSGHARDQAGVAAERGATAEVLQQLELITGGLDTGGLHDQMNALFNSFDDLASAPDDSAIRQVVLQRAESVAQAFTRTATAIDRLRERTVVDTAEVVRSINQLSEQIAVLDAEILGSTNVGADPNALLDQRDAKVTELASLADVNIIENSNGQVTVSLDGQLLVSNGVATALSVESLTDPALAVLGYDKIVVMNPSGRELSIRGGELAASLQALSQIIPDGKRALDDVSSELVFQVNTIHQAGVGLDGSTGLDLFLAGPGPGQVQVSSDVVGQPDRIAAAAIGAGALDNGNARIMAQLAESPAGPLSLFAEMVGSLAARVATANGSADAADAAGAQAANLAIAAGGVSLDEELTDLITAQRSYEAAARLMTAIDEMLRTLVNSTGLVGR